MTLFKSGSVDTLLLLRNHFLFFLNYNHYWWRALCRVPHSAKSKRQSRIRRRVLCRVPFVGHSAKKIGRQPLTASLPSAGSGRHSAKLFLFFWKSFAECLPDLALGKEILFFWKILCRVPSWPGTRQRKKIWKILCRVPSWDGTRQRKNIFFLENSLPSARVLTLGKAG